MNFDLDDPLADLLSDGSNSLDDIVGTANLKKSKNASKFIEQKTSTPSGKQGTTKGKLEDLFGIGDKGLTQSTILNTTVPTNETIYRPPIATAVASSPQIGIRKSVQPIIATPIQSRKEKSTINLKDKEDEDLFSELGFDPKKRKEPLKKKNILDDLLGISSDSQETVKRMEDAPSIQNRPKTTPTTQQINKLSRQSTFDKNESEVNTPYTPSVAGGRPRSAVMGRRQTSNTSLNPLGLPTIGNSVQSDNKNINTGGQSLNPKKAGIVDWLGLGQSIDSEEQKQPVKDPIEISQPNTSAQSNVTQPNTVLQPQPTSGYESDLFTQTAHMMNVLNTGTESVLENLKQQEQQLQVATHIHSQDQFLMEMQQKNNKILSQQETQFNEFLQKQIRRQQTLEATIKKQQEQINGYLQMIMIQPMLGDSERPVNKPEDKEKLEQEAFESKINQFEIDAELKRLELENNRLENLISTTQSNHDQEMDLMEKSYKKQISLMDEALEKSENRFRSELKILEEFYESKLATLMNEKDSKIRSYEENLDILHVEHGKAIQKLKADHEEVLEIIRSDNQVAIENIRKSRLLELNVLQENTSYLTTLRSASNQLDLASTDLHNIRDTIQENLHHKYEEREMRIAMKEKQIVDQEKRMENERNVNESERKRLLDLVSALEIKLNAITQSSSEEQWSLRQQQVSLEAARKSFEREKEFIREQLRSESRRVEDLKESQMLEQKLILTKIDEERLELLNERTKIETLARLNSVNISKVSQTEMDVAISIAQDAAKAADLQRDNFIRSQREYEVKKRELADKEYSILATQSKLDDAIRTAEQKQKQAESVESACRRTEEQLRIKIQLLQENFRELSNRESRLSAEKVDLSRERIEFERLRKKLYDNRCSLCKISERSQEMGDLLTDPNSRQPNPLDRSINYVPWTSDVRQSVPRTVDEFLDDELLSSLNRIRNDLKVGDLKNFGQRSLGDEMPELELENL